MKTTLNLPDGLMREIKLRAVQENRTMQDLIAELLQRALREPPPTERRHRVQFPLVLCGPAASPEQEMTPERVAQVLANEESEAARAPL